MLRRIIVDCRLSRLLPTAAFLLCFALAGWARGAALDTDTMASHIEPPYQLGEKLESMDVWKLVNLDGADAGYVFETEPLAPIPGFSGRPINLLVQLTDDGRILRVEILQHGEPVFVSGLGEAPFHEFVSQYSGHSIYEPMSVGVPYGKVAGVSAQVYLDGVTKATASVRIAHESILAAAFAVARERMQGIIGGSSPAPDPGIAESLTWDDLVEQGIATRKVVANREINALFAGTLWEDDDPYAADHPDEPYLDLWVIDIGPPAVARAVLTAEGLERLAHFLSVSPENEPILLIDAGRHGLVSDTFVRNTEPDLLSARQDGLPIALRDADLELPVLAGVPSGHQMVVRTDRRLGFDPTRPWDLSLKVVRLHGSFMPESGTRDITVTHQSPARFYLAPESTEPPSALESALHSRLPDLLALAVFLAVLSLVLLLGLRALAGRRRFGILRFMIMVLVIGFVGWWGQGQLSILTVMGVASSISSGQSLSFLLYDPFSLLIWLFVGVSLVLWGRGYFCGWLCPFGAMQELSAHAGRLLGLPQLRLRHRIDRLLKKIKYVILLALLVIAVFFPVLNDRAGEVEPFKTAVTTVFDREWFFVAYAVSWLLLGMVLFKGFCRYVCPLGAFLAVAGLLRMRRWIPRRVECGSPCQLCAVRCQYQAIDRSGRIDYTECFQCLDCVTIHDDPAQCAPLVLLGRKQQR